MKNLQKQVEQAKDTVKELETQEYSFNNALEKRTKEILFLLITIGEHLIDQEKMG